MEVFKKIKELRKNKYKSQEAFAKKLGVSRSLLTKIENGTKEISTKMLVNIADALNVSTDYLLRSSISKPMNFTEKLGTLREDIYINNNKVRSLLGSIGQYEEGDIVTEEVQEGEANLGLEKGVVMKGARKSSGKVTTQLKKTFPNLVTDLIRYLNENNLISKEINNISEIQNGQFIDINSDLRLSPFDVLMNMLRDLLPTIKIIAPQDPSFSSKEIEMIDKFLPMLQDKDTLHIRFSHKNITFLGRFDRKNLLVSTEDFLGSANILMKVSRVIPEGESYSLLSNKISNLLSEEKINDLVRSFQEIKIGEQISEKDIIMKGEFVLFEPVVVYK